ncbi:beta-ketoacyl-ACP synthase [Roseomonas terrae]|jgi:3-oxoacyl-[acyl-carrier-protein] synthase II|uniref:Beta-ketoacyl-ACP synthase n=1 Tax=Neoroseomonas terrae TaxID=424799 RepID=A0ABS5EBV0_9PROT|nr:beta-ketoacyl-ACP synthase [Neoroseomonas terrae]MBR0648493.1 beta-ketoacyl-ACP synthase [Neoroseomonas terrae]
MKKQDVVITGIGLVSSLGEGADLHWETLSRPGAKPVLDEAGFAPFPVHPLPALSLDKQIPKKGDQRQMEPWQRLGTYAAGLAIDQAGARDLVSDMHLIVAAGGGERDVAVDEAVATAFCTTPPDEAGPLLNEKLGTELRPTLFLAQLSNLLAGNISIVHGVTGSSRTFMGEESAAADAVRIAAARLAEGRGGIALVGGAYASQRWDLELLYGSGGALWRGAFAPVSARGEAGGFVGGALGAFLVLETAEHAAQRGATALAKLSGVATDTAHMRPDASAAAAAALWQKLGAPSDSLGVLSGMTGVAEARAAEDAFLAGLGAAAVRRTGSLIGHGIEATFPANVALGALALSRGGFYPAMDPADTGEGAVDRILVTGFGQWRGEALALLERVA